MKINAILPIATLLLSLSEPSSAAIGRAIGMVARIGAKGAEAASDVSDASNNDNSRRSFDIFPRVAVADGAPKAQANGKNRNDNGNPNNQHKNANKNKNGNKNKKANKNKNGNKNKNANKNKNNQEEDPMAGLPQPAANICEKQLKGVTVKFSVSKNNDVEIKNVPPACMTLATVFLGDNPDGGAPVPLGTSSLRYTDVSKQDIQKLRETLKN